ncbi:MAG: Rib/alpha-like domain-containing protein, partial [Eubacteriales bacterium]|nr:Rib/alpha-like domain-containing protein [Eubacteriales bacterium]
MGKKMKDGRLMRGRLRKVASSILILAMIVTSLTGKGLFKGLPGMVEKVSAEVHENYTNPVAKIEKLADAVPEERKVFFEPYTAQASYKKIKLENSKKNVELIQLPAIPGDEEEGRKRWRVVYFRDGLIYNYNEGKAVDKAAIGFAITKDLKLEYPMSLTSLWAPFGQEKTKLTRVISGPAHWEINPQPQIGTNNDLQHSDALLNSADVNKWIFQDFSGDDASTRTGWVTAYRDDQGEPIWKTIWDHPDDKNTWPLFSSRIDGWTSGTVNSDTAGRFRRDSYHEGFRFHAGGPLEATYTLEFSTVPNPAGNKDTLDFSGVLAASGSWQDGGYPFDASMIGEIPTKKTQKVQLVLDQKFVTNNEESETIPELKGATFVKGVVSGNKYSASVNFTENYPGYEVENNGVISNEYLITDFIPYESEDLSGDKYLPAINVVKTSFDRPGFEKSISKEVLPDKDGMKRVKMTITYTKKKTEAEIFKEENPKAVGTKEVIKGTEATTDGITFMPALPEGATVVGFADGATVDTSTAGDKPAVNVKVKFTDESIAEIPVVYTVVEGEAGTKEPATKDLTVNKNETPNAEDAITNKDELDAKSYEFKEPVDTTTPGDKEVTVVVTYNDGSKDEVAVKVHVRNDAEAYKETNTDAKGTKEVVKGIPATTDGITFTPVLPEGATVVGFAGGATVDTSVAGEKEPVNVTVKFADESTANIPVVYTVVEGEAGTKEPATQDLTVNKNETPNAEDAITNKDELDAKSYEFKEPVDTTTPGDKEVTVVVTYNDGSKDEVAVKVHVRNDAEAYKETNTDAKGAKEVVKGTEATTDGITFTPALPEGATVVGFAGGATVDTSVAGEKEPVNVTVKFADESTANIPVVYTVVEGEAGTKEPATQDLTVNKNETPNAEDAITNKDELDAKSYEFKEPVDTTTPGDKEVTVVVTYNDGSKDEVAVKVHVRNDAEAYKETNTDAKGAKEVVKGTEATTDGITFTPVLPEGATVVGFAGGATVDTSVAGEKEPVNVTVKFADESTANIPVVYTVVEGEAGTKEPATKDLTVNKNETPNAEDAITNKDELDAKSYEFKEPVDTTTPGDKEVTVVVTYNDGSKDEVAVKVHVRNDAEA